MKKLFQTALIIFVSLFISMGLFSCQLSVNSPQSSTATGTITGKVTFSNVELADYSGIMISLDKTDGLRSIAVTRSSEQRSIENTARTIIASSTPQQDGSYKFENLEPGTYTVYASSSFSSEKAVYTNVVVRSGENSVVESLQLTATGNIEGSVTIQNYDEESKTYTYDNLGILVFVAGTSYMAMTDSNGNFIISGVPAGNGYQLVATKNGIIYNLSSDFSVTANYTWFCGGWGFSSDGNDNRGKDGIDGKSIVWLGSYWSSEEITKPEYLNAYFNMTDGCSYIYDGTQWTLLAKSGANGKDGKNGKDGENGTSISWLGEYASFDDIESPEFLNAFYNTTDGCSYIYIWGWSLLAKAGTNGTDGIDGASIIWLGDSYEAPGNPKLNYAYFSTADGCSYIYNGIEWKLLAKAGTDGTSIIWKGAFVEAPTTPELNWAYYNYDDGCSYIWNGYEWYLLAKAGTDGNTIIWKGELSEAPESPELYWAYFNTSNGCSYIYVYGGWDLLSKVGQDGKSIIWLGSYSEPPESPNYLDAYYNTTNGHSYIWTGNWNLLSKPGADGTAIIWKGELSSAPANPQVCWAYYNTTDGCSYIFDGSKWSLLAKTGSSIVWKGEFESEPQNPDLNWAYYNTSDGCSYIYNGTEWKLLAKAGVNGATGSGINWLGSFTASSSITSPEYLDAYYNITDGCSYIYDGTEWKLLARKGADGSTGSGSGTIIWLGDYEDESEIIEPEALSVYYNTTTGCSYIYNGTEWKLLAKAGIDGVDGESINWLGELASDSVIVNPKYLDAYYNTTNGCSYIYTGSNWELLAKSAPEQSTIEVSTTYNIGDVLLSDGTVIPYSANRVFTNEQKQKAVGVLYGNEYGIPYGWLGIYNSCGGTSSGTYKWAKANSPGFNTSFTDISCDFDSNSSVGSGSFIGDSDGSNNWSYICSVDSYASAMIEENYPAFYYVKQYATRFGLTNTSYSNNWYLPSFAELCFIYRNKTTLNKVLNALGGTQLQNVEYWSSSQHPEWEDDAKYVNFSNGDTSDGLNNGGKEQQKRVCVVHSFTKDITPPTNVFDLSATYDRTSKEITVSWINPDASDLAYVKLSYSKNNTEIISGTTIIGAPRTESSFTVSNVNADGSTYKFTLYAVDGRGNKSTSLSKSITITSAEPEFTSFSIPTVNYLKEGNTVTATITGKNFNCASIDPSINFIATCPSKPLVVNTANFTVVNDNLLTATFIITGRIGEYDITVSCGEKSITSKLKVKNFGAYTDGDVLLNDGTVIPYDKNNLSFTDEQKSNAVGVLYCDEYGVPKGWLGLYNSYEGTNSGTYSWAKSDTVGDNTNFTDIICTPVDDIFIGDTDGSDNWAYICDMYPVATADAETNFPAFNYVNTYASTFSLTGDYAEGWYMPSIAELYYVFKSKTTVNNVLKALGGTELNSNYLSSSQYKDSAYSAWYINSYGGTGSGSKDYNNFYVCCVRAF